MPINDYRRRLKRIQQEAPQEDFRILELIKKGAFYDELTDEEKESYAQHWKTDRETLESVNNAVIGSLHFPLERRRPPRNREELERRILEVENMIDEINAEED